MAYSFAYAQLGNNQPLATINSDRLWSRLEALSRFTDPARPWTRRAFQEDFVRGRLWLKQEFEAAGLSTSIDAGGNLIGRLGGNGLPLVAGSHSDTVPSGGRFDGMLGLLAALEAAESFREQAVPLRHPLEVVDFLAEEPNDFGVSCIGSRSWAGALAPTDLATLAPAIELVGGDASRLHQPLRSAVAAYVELHIEQGVVLAEKQAEIGVVTAIVGIRRHEVTVYGRADHAGTTPMDLRRDALVGAADFIRNVEQLAHRQPPEGAYLVATIGKITVEPNAVNAVPGSVRMILEVRSTDERVLLIFEESIWSESEEFLRRRGLDWTHSLLSQTKPTACSPHIQGAIEKASRSAGFPSVRLPSGAGHDGVFVARIGPMGMIFVPCRDGRSHTPEEWAEPADCGRGAQVLADTLLILDQELAQ
jgi:beta-ureidopropionase / N-carbamoyl-L-amino-acid hydrolase